MLGLLLGGGCSGSDNANGAGLTLDGTFFHESGGEVRPDALGPVLHSGVPLRDGRTDVRAIEGVPVGDAVAVESDPGGPAEQGWYVFSRDEDAAADPWADAVLVPVLLPPS